MAEQGGPASEKRFKVRLASGRVLGPLDLDRIRLLILKGQIAGTETARVYPQGEWTNINQIPEIAELIVAKLEGRLKAAEPENSFKPIQAGQVNLNDPTVKLPGAEDAPPTVSLSKIDETKTPSKSIQLEVEDDEDEEKTVVGGMDANQSSAPDPTGADEDEKTVVGSLEPDPVEMESSFKAPSANPISEERTVLFDRSEPEETKTSVVKDGKVTKVKKKKKSFLKGVILAACLALLASELFLTEDKNQLKTPTVIKPKLPLYVEGQRDQKKSKELYEQALKYYILDNVEGYKRAADLLHKAASLDTKNVKALAMLASCYLNLIDSSNKDENYFAVIFKLIEMSRAQNQDLPETIIADTEFYVTVNKADAALARIKEYTKLTSAQAGEIAMFYYLAWAFYNKGENNEVARYINLIADNKVFSPKVFYLRGLNSESFGSHEDALRDYQRGVKFSKTHAKSRLKIAEVSNRLGKLKEAAPQLKYLLENPQLSTPKDLAKAYFLNARLNQLFKNWDLALGDVEKAVKLDRNNHDYLLELYTLRARAGESIDSVRGKARMFYFLSQGEAKLRDGKYHAALSEFIQARQADLKAPLPLLKMGNMFYKLNDMSNARENYRKATQLAPNHIGVWSKYIKTLIESYEWQEAEAALSKFRSVPNAKSSVDKLAGDMYAKQGLYVQALNFYKKSMSRKNIDSDVYVSYANALALSGNCQDAPFFYALALRFDPLNMDAIGGTSKCIAETEDESRAIRYLEDELNLITGDRAEILTMIADFQIQQGDWELAQKTVKRAMRENSEAAGPWRIQAKLYLNQENKNRDWQVNALRAFKSYSDRNPSDPTGYLERYQIFLGQGKYKKADEELNRIYAIYKKFPSLHYFKAQVYEEKARAEGNSMIYNQALDEYELELKNNPNHVDTLIGMGTLYTKKLNEPQKGLDYLKKAMQLAPQNSVAKYRAGLANHKLKNYQGAVALYRAALEKDKGNPIIYRLLGLTYKEMGDEQSANQALRKYLELAPDDPNRHRIEQMIR